MSDDPDSRSQVDMSRIGWVGPLAIVCSVGAVLVVRVGAVTLLRPDPKFTPLGWAFPILDTAILTTGAVLVFGAIASSAARRSHGSRAPAPWFRRPATPWEPRRSSGVRSECSGGRRMCRDETERNRRARAAARPTQPRRLPSVGRNMARRHGGIQARGAQVSSRGMVRSE